VLEIYKPNIPGNKDKEHGMRQLSRPVVLKDEVQSDFLVCSAPLIDFSAVVSKHFKITVVAPEAPVITFQSHGGEQKHTLSSGDSIELQCKAVGKPIPAITWTFPTLKAANIIFLTQNSTTDWEITSTVRISDFQEAYEGTYLCNASNYLGNALASFSLQLPQGLSTAQKVGWGAGLGSMLTLLVVILGLIYAKIILQRRKYQRETLRVKGEFFKGIPGDKQKIIEGEDYNNGDFVATIESQPFDKSLEVPFENWTIG